MDNRKDLKAQYKSRQVIGGIFSITCGGDGQVWLRSTKDLNGQANRFNFAISSNSCPEPGMRPQWAQYGSDSFSFTILEKLEKAETQSDGEFAEDIKTLYEMWLEKQAQNALE